MGLRCDGTGWLDRGEGLEPCPSCNPWNRERWRDGRWHDPHPRIPRDYVMPPPCPPSYAAEGSYPVSSTRAMQLVVQGMREHYAEEGYGPDEIEAVISRRLPAVAEMVASIAKGEIKP
jgi:hypothetical protein